MGSRGLQLLSYKQERFSDEIRPITSTDQKITHFDSCASDITVHTFQVGWHLGFVIGFRKLASITFTIVLFVRLKGEYHSTQKLIVERKGYTRVRDHRLIWVCYMLDGRICWSE